METVSDDELVAGLVVGTDANLVEIYRRYGGPAFGLAFRVTSDRALAEDVVQDSFLQLWRRPRQFDAARGSLRSFLLTIVHGRAVDAVRSREARRRREMRDVSESTVLSTNVDHHAWNVIVKDQVAEAMSTLPVNERRPIELAYFEGLTYLEVAQLLDTPEGTIKSRIRSGLRRLRVALDERGVTESERPRRSIGVDGQPERGQQ